jgi:hypothetical protein
MEQVHRAIVAIMSRKLSAELTLQIGDELFKKSNVFR